jgi:hypothetical protein
VNIGTLTTGVRATVDPQGTISSPAGSLHWRVWAGDRWLVPGRDAVARQGRPGPAPVVQTAVRIPDGDAIEHVYAAGDGVIIVEIENASPHAIGVAFNGMAADELSASRPVGAVESDGAAAYPVPHRTRLRVALERGIDVRVLPDVEAVVRGWDHVLDRGMRTELPDPLQREIDSARVDLLLAPPSPGAFVALEAWGFDREAITMWSHFSFRERRAVRREHFDTRLLDVRAQLVRDDDAIVELFPGFADDWLGQNLAVHDVPLRRGLAGFAVRWHGPRPALLWDVPDGVTIRVPNLDPDFSSTEPRGETLLAGSFA